MGNSTDTDIVFAGGRVYRFVLRWLGIIFGNAFLRDSQGIKDWRLLENFSIDEMENRYLQSEQPSNVISFRVNRKTHPPLATQNRHIYRAINKLVVQHCIQSALTLPGFYAFLRAMTEVQTNYVEAFAIDERLISGWNDLITGYWEKIRPSLHDVTYGQSADMAADMTALQGINQLTQEEANSGKEEQLTAQPPFKKLIQADLKQAFTSKPTPTPTYSM